MAESWPHDGVELSREEMASRYAQNRRVYRNLIESTRALYAAGPALIPSPLWERLEQAFDELPRSSWGRAALSYDPTKKPRARKNRPLDRQARFPFTP